MRPAFLAVAVALTLAAPLGAQGRARTTVVGQVVDAATGAPIPAVELRVSGTRAGATTGQDGRFRLSLRSGTYGLVMTRMGYESQVVAMEVAAQPVDLGVLALKADAVLLEALRVSVDRVDRMRRASAFASYSYGIDELARSSWMSATDFVSSRAGLFAVSCGMASAAGIRDCVLHRGRLTRVCVMMDDVPLFAGLAGLAGYQVRDFARVNVYQRGAFVQVYTPDYLVQIARRDYRPMSVQMQMMAYCRSNVGGAFGP